MQEIELKSNIPRADESCRYSLETPCTGHHDTITDLLLCKTEKQLFLASSSRDGVIKLWK